MDELLAMYDEARGAAARDRLRASVQLVLTTVVLVSAFGLTGGYGAFVAAGQAPDGLVVTGNLTFDLTLDPTAVPFTEAVGDPALRTSLRPDDATDDPTDDVPSDAFADRVLRATNTSEDPVSLHLQVESVGLGGPAVDDPDGLAVVVWRCLDGTYTHDDPLAVPTCSGTEAVLDLNGAAAGVAADVELDPVEVEASLAPSGSFEARVRIVLPHRAPVEAIGDDLTLRVGVTAQPARPSGVV